MADESVYMDTEYVQSMSNDFKKFGETCGQVSNLLDTAIKIISAINLFGFGVATWVIEILKIFKEAVKQLGEELRNISGDIASAREAFITGDTQGSKRFVG